MNNDFDREFAAIKLLQNRNDNLCPPFTIQGGITEDFTKICNKYYELLDGHINKGIVKYDVDFLKILPKVKHLSSKLRTTLQKFLIGNIKSAYDVFDEIFKDKTLYECFQKISIPLSDISNRKKPLFRVRKSEQPLSKREQMFHIPFKQRHMVSAQRYSVAGLPCLYLGTSLYICWQEMNKPDFDKLYISSFESNDNESKILNFAHEILFYKMDLTSYSKKRIGSNPDVDTLLAYLTLYPLIIACSFIKKDHNASFNQEYIIPNLLMQWISTNYQSNIVGLAYRSTKIVKTDHNNKAINVVLPPKTTYEDILHYNFCPNLVSMFKLTPPISWQVLKTLDYDLGITSEKEKSDAEDLLRTRQLMFGINNFDDDLLNFYPLTDFFKLEVSIDRLLQYGAITESK